MKFVEEGHSTEDLNKALDRLYRRIVALENSTSVVIPRSAPRKPQVNEAWHDIEGGAINVWNGSTWNIFTKD